MLRLIVWHSGYNLYQFPFSSLRFPHFHNFCPLSSGVPHSFSVVSIRYTSKPQATATHQDSLCFNDNKVEAIAEDPVHVFDISIFVCGPSSVVESTSVVIRCATETTVLSERNKPQAANGKEACILCLFCSSFLRRGQRQQQRYHPRRAARHAA